jgi:dihydroorotase
MISQNTVISTSVVTTIDPAAGDLRHRGAHGRHVDGGGRRVKLLVKGGRVIDPASGRDAVGDVAIVDGRIVESMSGKPERVLEAKGLVVAPGLIDLAARLREPGYEYKATLESEMNAAVAGGVTSLACPPDTDPPLDEPGLVDMLRRRAVALQRARVYPVGALTVKLEGRQLTEMAELAESGCVAFSQADRPIADTQVLWRALQYASTYGFPVWLRAEDPWLAKDGVAHDGEVATRLGLAGIPAFAETVALGALFELVRATGARVHVCRISSAAGVAMLRRARHDGLPLTCDVAVHHVHLSDMDLGYFDAQCRLDPPLRSPRDRDALAAGLADGTIDCIVSDHTPVDDDAKLLPFAEAAPGATGLELLLPLALQWGVQAKLSLAQTLARVTSAPARILGVDAGRIAPGAPGDLVVFDPQAPWRVDARTLRSQGRNSAFFGRELTGRVRATVVAGNIVHEA